MSQSVINKNKRGSGANPKIGALSKVTVII